MESGESRFDQMLAVRVHKAEPQIRSQLSRLSLLRNQKGRDDTNNGPSNLVRGQQYLRLDATRLVGAVLARHSRAVEIAGTKNI